MGTWDIALLVVVGYLAIVSLVRLMLRRRDQKVVEVRRLMKQEQQRRQAQRQETDTQRDAAA